MDSQIRELEKKLAENPSEENTQALMRAQLRAGILTHGENALERNGVVYKLTPWIGSRTDAWGNSPACRCPELKRVHRFCVCRGIAYCPNCGYHGCVGGHD